MTICSLGSENSQFIKTESRSLDTDSKKYIESCHGNESKSYKTRTNEVSYCRVFIETQWEKYIRHE